MTPKIMQIVQSTWVRYHHIDLARELEKRDKLQRVFTCLPWWRADMESKNNNIPRDKISCNFLLQGIRRLSQRLPGYNKAMDSALAVQETKFYSRWVANNLPGCDAYIGISGTGLHAGRLAKSRGAGYVMDRGSSQIRVMDDILQEEYKRWKLPFVATHAWLVENEEREADEACLITVPSEFAKRSFIKSGTPEEKIRVVPYGVSFEEFNKTNGPEITSGRFIVTFVGQFSIRKGAPYLLEAFKRFKHPNKELRIIGAVSPEMVGIIGRIGINFVRLLGIKPRNEVKNYLSKSNVLVLPSVEDGFGLVLLQAAACRCPIIASTNTGFDTLFADDVDGIMVPPRDSDAITEAFDRLAMDPELGIRLSNSALLKMQALGGWESYADSMIDVCRQAQEITRVRSVGSSSKAPTKGH